MVREFSKQEMFKVISELSSALTTKDNALYEVGETLNCDFIILGEVSGEKQLNIILRIYR